jgi:lipid-A-disaccharide synthase
MIQTINTKVYLVAGEASGDLIGGQLIHSLKKLSPISNYRAWGGERMEAAGAKLSKHIRETNFMGFWEVLRNAYQIFHLFKEIKTDIQKFQPDIVVLIDYPGFNLRLAKWLHQNKIPVVYYVSPQVWAWKASRIKKIKKWVNLMITILPFEKDFYARFGYEVEYVGHPLIDEIASKKKTKTPTIQETKILALLPGSRFQEISKMLPIMTEAAKKLPQFKPIIVKSPLISTEEYTSVLGPSSKIEISPDGAFSILERASLACVGSGTATLETALMNVPQVVCYRGNSLSFYLAKKLVKIPFISLVNLIAGRKIVEELVQERFTTSILTDALLKADQNRSEILKGYLSLKRKLGKGGASDKAAALIIQFINERLN